MAVDGEGVGDAGEGGFGEAVGDRVVEGLRGLLVEGSG